MHKDKGTPELTELKSTHTAAAVRGGVIFFLKTATIFVLALLRLREPKNSKRGKAGENYLGKTLQELCTENRRWI